MIGPEPIIKMEFKSFLLGIFFRGFSLSAYMSKKRCYWKSNTFNLNNKYYHYFLCLGSEETVNLFLPLALLLARTFLPLAVAMRSLKPCLFLLFLLDG